MKAFGFIQHAEEVRKEIDEKLRSKPKAKLFCSSDLCALLTMVNAIEFWFDDNHMPDDYIGFWVGRGNAVYIDLQCTDHVVRDFDIFEASYRIDE